MLLELELADLAATRFAISPLGETIRAVQLLAGYDAPAVRTPELGAELARLRATPAAAVRASLRRVWEGHPWPLGLALLGDEAAGAGASAS